METKKMGTAMAGGMTALVGIVLVAGAAQAFAPKAPEYQYFCPICEMGFLDYDALESHFTTEHPTTPIDIIWE